MGIRNMNRHNVLAIVFGSLFFSSPNCMALSPATAEGMICGSLFIFEGRPIAANVTISSWCKDYPANIPCTLRSASLEVRITKIIGAKNSSAPKMAAHGLVDGEIIKIATRFDDQKTPNEVQTDLLSNDQIFSVNQTILTDTNGDPIWGDIQKWPLDREAWVYRTIENGDGVNCPKRLP